MDYIKAQQFILADLMANTPRGVCMYHDKTNGLTVFFSSDAYTAYAIPVELVCIDIEKCNYLDRPLCRTCPAEAAHELVHRGEMLRDEKRTLLKLRTREGMEVYIDKKLRDRFGKTASLYSDSPLGVISVYDTAPEGLRLVGYLCPINPKKIKNI